MVAMALSMILGVGMAPLGIRHFSLGCSWLRGYFHNS